MKKLYLLIFCAVLSIGARAQFSGSGNGTEADPYRIYSEIHLAQMANFLNQEGVVFELMKDVDLSSYIAENSPSQGWTPIGVESAPFKGVLKGNNHTISGLTINRPNADNVGLFGYVVGATITSLNLEGKSVIGRNWVGGLIGNAYGTCTISNCNITISGQIEGLCDIGGIVGFTHETSSIKTCRVKSNLVSKGYSDWQCGTVGGLCATALNATIQDCHYEGNVTGKIAAIGGLFGNISNTNVSNVVGTGKVSGEARTGGIAANAHATNTFTNVKFTGDVNGTQNVAGGIGSIENGSKNTLSNCTSIGNIVGNLNVAGMAGLLEPNSNNTFDNCHHKGTITSSGDYTGGIVGKSEGGCIAGMESCSHFGDIEGRNYVGGMVGAIFGNVVTTPTLHTYYLSNNSKTNTKSLGPFYDTIENGSIKTNSINNCTAIGNIHGSQYVGGMIGKDEVSVGYTSSSNKLSAYNYVWIDGAPSGTTQSWLYTTTYSKNITNIHLTNSFFSGNINGTSNVGGLIGHKECGSITNCYTYATIVGESNIGGIAGTTTGSVVNHSSFSLTLKSNVAINSIISASSSNVGRIYASRGDAVTIGALGSPESNRALTQTSVMLCGVAQDVVDDEQNGTSVGPSMLKLKGNYVSWGWNFDDNWNILETECYPYKKYQAAPPVIKSKLESHDTSISGQSLDGGTVYMYYKDRDAVSTECTGNDWTFATDALQSGAQVQLYADVEGKTPSYLTSATVKYPGSGTEEDPWRIYSAEDLQGAYNSGYYKLMNDIDLTSWINENSPTEGWQAIGRNSTVATYINGDGHTVKGLWINTTQGYNGLFSNYSAGYIKNLNVEVASGKKVKGGDYTGILIGRMANGQIVNCNVIGDVEGTNNLGGLAGYVENSSLTGNTFDGSLTTQEEAYVGGMTGYAKNAEINSCKSAATIVAKGLMSRVGGLIGATSDGGYITKSMANVKITCEGSNSYVGGLVGNLSTELSQCYSEGSVTATGDETYTGGLVGYANENIGDSYSTANVSGTQYSAGLVGYTFKHIYNSYAKGDVKGVQYGAGLVGELDGMFANSSRCVAANNKLDLTSQSAWGCRVIGGFKNDCKEPAYDDNYALNTMQVSLNNVPQKKTDDNIEGVAKTAAELMASQTYIYLGWDMSKVWGIEEGESYPYLLWEFNTNSVVEITLDKTSLELSVGTSATLTPSVMPLSATNKRLYWATSNSAVATVENGVVTAVGAGTANIFATSTDGSDITATCKVTVTENGTLNTLNTLVDNATNLYNNSTEGSEVGQYYAGAREALLKAINDVRSKISATMTEADINECTSILNKAISDFQSKKVAAGSDTDYAVMDDVIYIQNKEVQAGSQAEISIELKNSFDATGYQFEMELPEGFSVPTNEDDEYMIELSTARTTAKKHNIFEIAKLNNGNMQVICNSTKNYTFTTGEGEVAIMTLNVDNSVEDGDYPIIIRNIAISDVNAKVTRVPYAKYTITVKSFTPGDANVDGYIDVGDITAIVGHIQENEPETFSAAAADVNSDGFIDVGDITGVVNLIIENANASAAGARMRDKAATTIADYDNVIYAEPISMKAGEQKEVSIMMNNNRDICGFQFEIKLPEGLGIATEDDEYLIDLSTERTTAKKHNIFEVTELRNGNIQVICSSTKNSVFAGTEGEVLTITLEANSTLADGVYEMELVDVRMTDTQAVVDHVGNVKSEITIGNPTGINDTLSKNEGKVLYNLNGQRVNKYAKGIIISNGKKILK